MEPFSSGDRWEQRLSLEGGATGRALIFGVAAVFLAVESVFARHFGVHFDLAILVVIYLAREHAFVPGLLLAFAIAYLGDLFSGENRGVYLSAAVVVFIATRVLAFRFFGGRWTMVLVLCVVGSVGAFLLCAFSRIAVGEWGPNTFERVARGFPSVVIGAILFGNLVQGLLRAIDERFRVREEFLFGATRR